MQLKKVCFILFTIFFATPGPALKGQDGEPPFLRYLNHPWVDSVFNSLSPEERAAQLIWVAAFSNRDIGHEVYLSNLITQTGIGGLIFFQDQPEKQTEMINYFQRISKVPMLIAADGEWGIGMRLEGVVKFPFQLTLGAIRNDSLIYKMGKAVADQFKRASVQINLAPVADVNNNPGNPVINYRSFGEDPVKTGKKSEMYMKGMQDNGIIAVAKHFPGHGDTETDSHLDLPVINQTRQRLDNVELVPFRTLINAGVSGIMPGHLSVPALDSTRNLPATLSQSILTQVLKNELSFKGLTLSDGMNMGGVTKYSVPGTAEVTALKAGIDILEYVEEPEKAVKAIAEAVKTGVLKQQDIDDKCRKVLAAKYWAGLENKPFVPEENIRKDLSSPTANALIRELYAGALTLLKNEDSLIPLKNLPEKKVLTIAVNKTGSTLFQNRISDYMPSDFISIDPSDKEAVDKLLKELPSYNLVIAGIYGLDQKPQSDFGITNDLISIIDKITDNNKCIIIWFGNPYSIARVKSLSNAAGLLLSYQENEITEDLSAQLIFGGIGADGTLPVTINDQWKEGFCNQTPGNLRVSYGLPENVGISSRDLERNIDSIANLGLTKQAYPGCEVVVARKGMVIFHKTYGYQTYDNRIALRKDDLFDLASVTKVSSTLAGLMLLDSEGKFSTEQKLGYYMPYFKGSNKENLLMKDILTHQAGLVSWIPFWRETVKKDTVYKKKVYSHELSEKYPLKVAEGLYINKNYRSRIFNEIKKSPLGEKKYVYSDLSFIISTGIIDNLTGEKWYEFVTRNIYHKIGAYDIGFNPYKKYSLSRIVPTEYDSLFRKQQLHGTVHDEGAAMLGGISGHAGLFATANDLMKLMELYRRMGNYGGEQLISEEVLRRYAKYQFPENNNRRGLGFDKPLVNNAELVQKESYPTRSASPESFGHSGYTGTFVWIDPVYEISYVFFSNRVYPTRNNNRLSELNIRTDILQAIYDSIKE
jgi:beta-glucosidase-like glycosyl hydrolase/CubicO group peptidase (beta-lactamase class C family)